MPGQNDESVTCDDGLLGRQDAVTGKSGSSTGVTSTIIDRYLYDEGGQVLSDDTSAGLSWYLSDHEGSIRKVLSATGSSTLATYTYDAYGNVTSSQQPDRFGYTGQELDAETGLSYYGARYLDTLVGGFINQDPGGDGTNPYEYVHSDPIDLKDPTGMYTSEVFGAILPTSNTTTPRLIAPADEPEPFSRFHLSQPFV